MTNTRINLIYYVYLGFEGNKRIEERVEIVKNQIDWLVTKAIPEVDNAFLVPCSNEYGIELLNKIPNIDFFRILNQYNFKENLYEYPGILAVLDQSNAIDEHDLIVYCHSKGTGRTSHISMGVFKYNIEILFCNKLRSIFLDDSIDVAGAFPSPDGFVWYNFWAARAKYIKTLELRKSDDRYYFEGWIGGGEGREKTYTMFDEKYKYLPLRTKDSYSAKELNECNELVLLFEIYSLIIRNIA